MLPLLDDARGQWAHLPAGLIAHLERVSEGARALAARWDVDPERAALGGFLHDVARAQPPPTLLRQARDLGLPVGPVEEAVPLLLHGPVGARLACPEADSTEQDVVTAIAWHSTAREGMSNLEKVVFLADKLDPDKQGYYPPGLERLPELAQEHLDLAVVRYLEWQVRHLLERGGVIHPAALDARNWLLLRNRDGR